VYVQRRGIRKGPRSRPSRGEKPRKCWIASTRSPAQEVALGTVSLQKGTAPLNLIFGHKGICVGGWSKKGEIGKNKTGGVKAATSPTSSQKEGNHKDVGLFSSKKELRGRWPSKKGCA